MVRFSDFDLIEELRQNARISYVELAKKFEVTETAIRKRVHSLEKKGVIKGYTAIIDYKQLGYNINAVIGIDTLPEKLFNIIDDVQKHDSICVYTSSGDHMLMVEKCFKNTTELNEYIKNLEHTKGVTKVCPAIIIEKIK